MHRMNAMQTGPRQRALFEPAARPGGTTHGTTRTAWRLWLALVAMPALWAGAAQAQTQAPAPVVPLAAAAPLASWPQWDLNRYLGTWYEVARLPNRFQAQCVADTQAVYTRLPDGAVSVLNRCRTANGGWTQAVGRAEPDANGIPARLRVRFAPAWLSWLPAVWGNYWVIDLDPAYTLAAVSEPRREFLWVLSRTPTPDPAAWAALQQRLVANGFSLGALVLTPHGPSSAPVPAGASNAPSPGAH
jgi:apolipoprotein D and lipocalin family protein